MREVTRILFSAIGQVKTETVFEEDRILKETEVRIAPAYIGICGSDLHVLAGAHPFAKPPIVSGHEISAVITEVGSAVRDICVGDHVVVDPIMACMVCRACLKGRFNLCEPPQVAGFRAPGFARSCHIVPARNIHVAAKSIPLDVLAFAEPAACARHCVTRIGAENREQVLVIGAGTIGLSIIQALRIMGAGEITVIEPDQHKRQLALKYGAAKVFAPGQLQADQRFTAVIDVVASAQTIMDACQRVVAGGTVVCMGVPDGQREIPLPSMQRFERDFISSAMYVPEDFAVVIDWLEQGKFDTQDLISAIFPVRDAAQAYITAQQPSSIKVLIKFDEQTT